MTNLQPLALLEPTPQRIKPVEAKNYKITGPYTPWRPLTITTDGSHTVILFPPNLDLLPRLAMPGVSYRVDGNRYLIDGILSKVILQLGKTRIEATNQDVLAYD